MRSWQDATDLTGDDVMVVAPIPYTHMDHKDARLFYQTMNALLTYANRRLRVVGDQPLTIDGHDRARQRAATRVGEALWRQPSLVDDFVAENPARLSREHLELARPWRHAVHDLFTCVHAEADVALYLNGEALFCVGAMERDADALVHAVPSLMVLTLLPFREGIVLDGKAIHLSDRARPGAAEHIAEQLLDALDLGVISTARQLVDYARSLPSADLLPDEVRAYLDEALGISWAKAPGAARH